MLGPVRLQGSTTPLQSPRGLPSGRSEVLDRTTKRGEVFDRSLVESFSALRSAAGRLGYLGFMTRQTNAWRWLEILTGLERSITAVADHFDGCCCCWKRVLWDVKKSSFERAKKILSSSLRASHPTNPFSFDSTLWPLLLCWLCGLSDRRDQGFIVCRASNIHVGLHRSVWTRRPTKRCLSFRN